MVRDLEVIKVNLLANYHENCHLLDRSKEACWGLKESNTGSFIQVETSAALISYCEAALLDFVNESSPESLSESIQNSALVPHLTITNQY